MPSATVGPLTDQKLAEDVSDNGQYHSASGTLWTEGLNGLKARLGY